MRVRGTWGGLKYTGTVINMYGGDDVSYAVLCDQDGVIRYRLSDRLEVLTDDTPLDGDPYYLIGIMVNALQRADGGSNDLVRWALEKYDTWRKHPDAFR